MNRINLYRFIVFSIFGYLLIDDAWCGSIYENPDPIKKCDTIILKKDVAGTCSTFYGNGRVKDVDRYKNNVRHGKSESWFENGKIESVNFFENGCDVDTAKMFYSNGNLRTFIPYKNCEFHGDIISYDSTGRVVGESHFINGKLRGTEKHWYSNGNLKKISTEDSLENLDNIAGEYYENGKTKWEAKYDHGKKLTAIEYYENNQLARDETYFEDGKRLKTGKYFSPAGKPTGEIIDGNGSYIKCVPNYGCTKFYYENGKKIKTEKVSDAGK